MSFTEYYSNQAGSGIQGYQAFKSQRGRGIFGTLWRNIAWPFLKYAGKKALNLGLDVGKDAAYGLNLKDSLKSRVREHGADVVDDIAGQAKKILKGEGKGKVQRKRKRVPSSVGKQNKKPKITKKKKPATKKRKYKRQTTSRLFRKA